MIPGVNEAIDKHDLERDKAAIGTADFRAGQGFPGIVGFPIVKILKIFFFAGKPRKVNCIQTLL